MRIILDAMGGDNAPKAPVLGALQARERYGVELVLVGQEEKIRALLPQGQPMDGIEIVDAREVITMEDDPSTAVRRKKDASMSAALELLRDGKGDAVVSAGSTGALLAGATLVVKRIRGIRRAAFAPVLPNGGRGVILIDCGANAECTPEYLLQFAYMGSFYAKRMLGIGNPRVGLLSNGTEATKGAALQKETYPLLEEAAAQGRICFLGNVEASQLLDGGVDVVVTDGFTGNVLLKGLEGTVKFVSKQLKGLFLKNLRTKLAALAVRGGIAELKKSLDPNEVGGTALMGIGGIVIKAHGSANESAICGAVRQALVYAESGLLDDIRENMDYMRLAKPGAEEAQ